MGRMKIGIAVAGAVLVLLGVVAMVTMRSDSGPSPANTASQAPATTTGPSASYVSPTVPPITAPPAKASPGAPAGTQAAPKQTAPAKATPTTIASQPSVQEIQKLIAGITAQIQAPPVTASGTAPPTKEQIEAQVREQLRQLGINY